MTLSLSLAEARRLALAAQGFGRTPRGAIAHRHLQAQIERLGVLQIDSVNALVQMCIRDSLRTLRIKVKPSVSVGCKVLGKCF